MQCERLIRMIKSWYVHVREETMAPARMVSFMEEHVETCDICLQDPEVREEIAKITEMVLPESKIPKAVRQQNQAAEEANAEAEEENGDQEEEAETESDTLDDDEEEALDVETDLISGGEKT